MFVDEIVGDVVDNGVGTATLQVVVDDRVAKGAAWVESGYGATAALGGGRVLVTAIASTGAAA